MQYPIHYDNFCPDCGAPMIQRLAVKDGERKGQVKYKCSAIANIYGIVIGGRGCVLYLKSVLKI